VAEAEKIEKYKVRSITGFLWEIKKARHLKNISDNVSAQSDKTLKISARKLKERAVEKAGEEFLKVLTL
jgi:hypothetical protein